jgi:hypothetical protein
MKEKLCNFIKEILLVCSKRIHILYGRNEVTQAEPRADRQRREEP